MKERPILFTGPMVLAILAGRKTQTRRPVKWKRIRDFNLGFSGLQPGHYMTGVETSPWVLYSRRGDGVWEQRTEPLRCPYGVPGDRLWVRETWRVASESNYYPTDDKRIHVEFRAGAVPGFGQQRSRFSVERDADVARSAWGKGKSWSWRPGIHMPRWASRLLLEVTEVRVERLAALTEIDACAEGFGSRYDFLLAWDAMYGSGPFGLDADPWVWVVSFRRVEAARSAA